MCIRDRHMFETQKYSLLLSIGYFVYDFAFCLFTAEAGGLQMQTYAHHVFAIGGAVMTTWAGGLLGSVC